MLFLELSKFCSFCRVKHTYMFLEVLHGLAVGPDHTKNLLFVFMSVFGMALPCLLYFPLYSKRIKVRIDVSHNNKILTIVFSLVF